MNIALLVICVCAACYQLRFFSKSTKSEQDTWKKLILQVEPVNPEIFRWSGVLGSGVLTESELSVIVTQIGGLKGLRRLEKNVDLMLRMAVFAERWDQHYAPVFAELLRRDAMELKRAIRSLKFSLLLCRTPGARNWKKAIASYMGVRARLFAIYREVHVGLLPEIQEVF